MDANQRIHNDADQLADMYANLESRIFTEIIQVLQKGRRQDVTAENVIEWQAQQLAKAGLLVKKVIQIMAEYDQLDPAYIEQVLQQDGYQIVDETTAELEKLGKKAPKISSNANNLLDSLVNQTRQTLENTVNQRLLTRNINQNAAVRTYQSILKKSTIETVTGLKTHDKAIKDAIYKQIDEGIPILKDKAGRTWSLEAYTRMVLTTTANRAYNDARTKRMQEMGQSLCVMTAHPNSRPACAYIQGKVVNIVPDDSPNYNPKYDTIYNHGYGTPAGTLGINCRHVLFPFEDGVNVNHQPQYDPQEAIKNGNLQQRQRAYERSIREAKKRLRTAELLDDKEAISRYKTLVRARQNRLREFIKETNAGKHNILIRDYSREGIFAYKESGAIKERAKSFMDFEPMFPDEEKAKKLYVQFAQRDSKQSIRKISKAGNISEKDAAEIYKHIFVDKHLTLDANGNKVMAKFVPDIDMAQSFQRIFNGQELLNEDIIMLKHELYERQLMKANPDWTYKHAHEIVDKKYNYKKAVDMRKAKKS